MSIVEIIVIVAIGLILFIVIRRLPATRGVSAITSVQKAPVSGSMITSSAGSVRNFSKGFSGRSQRAQKGIMVRLKSIFGSIEAIFVSLGARLAGWIPIKRRPKVNPKEELAKQLKKPEHRSFWIDEGKKKEDEATASLVAATYFDQAEEAFKRHDFRRAETLYLEAARENPHNSKIFNRLGVIYLEQQNFGDSIEAFKTALQYDDKVGSRHFNLALAYIGQGNYEEALNSLRKAIQFDAKNDKYKKILEEVAKKC